MPFDQQIFKIINSWISDNEINTKNIMIQLFNINIIILIKHNIYKLKYL